MDIIHAVKHLGLRFSSASKKQNQALYLNQNDINALNKIAESVELMQKQQYEANQLFGKLYIFVYMRFLSKHQATVMDTRPRKELHSILQKPMSQWIEEFKQQLNDNEMYSLLESVGVDLKHPATISDSERMQNTSKAEKVAEKLLNEVWDTETVTECLTVEINNAINKYRS